jgi:hypothetical protein
MIDNNVSKGLDRLNECAPLDRLNKNSAISTPSKLRRPGREEAFCRLGDPVTLGCIIEPKKDYLGYFSGEFYYPVVTDLQEKVGTHLRLVAFHPCQSQTGENFIFPQKLKKPDIRSNSWTCSLDEALNTPKEQWLRLWSNPSLKRYEHEAVEINADDEPAYANFKQDLDNALQQNIIRDLEHPVIQRLKEPKSGDSGWEAIPNV